MAEELRSLNDDDLDVVMLERRLEMSVVSFASVASGGEDCLFNCGCYCPKLNTCGTRC